MASTRRLTTARPRPAPPYFTACCGSAWPNSSNTLSRASPGTPGPVSLTEKRRVAMFFFTWGQETTISTPPASVNFTALPARLNSIWRRRPSSARTSGTSSSTVQAMSRPLSCAFGLSSSVTPWTSSSMESGEASSSTLPASMRARSSSRSTHRPEQVTGGPGRLPQPGALGAVEPGAREQAEHADHAVQRRANLMAHQAQEILPRLQPLGGVDGHSRLPPNRWSCKVSRQTLTGVQELGRRAGLDRRRTVYGQARVSRAFRRWRPASAGGPSSPRRSRADGRTRPGTRGGCGRRRSVSTTPSRGEPGPSARPRGARTSRA